MSTFAKQQHPWYMRLRKLRPAQVFAIMPGGEVRKLALTKGRNTWNGCIESALNLGAEGLELRDDDDAVLDVLIPPEEERARARAAQRHVSDAADPDVELEAGPMTAEVSHADQVARVVLASVDRLVDKALDAADRATMRNAEHQRAVLDAAISVMKVTADRTERLERVLGHVVRANERALAAAQEAAAAAGRSSDDDGGTDLARQAMQVVLSALGGGAHEPMPDVVPDDEKQVQ